MNTIIFKPGVILAFWLVGTMTADAVGEERYYGGAFNGDAGAKQLVYPQADLQQRFGGGSFDGEDQQEVIQNLYADALLRFGGGGYDGHDESRELDQPNPLVFDSDKDELLDWWELKYVDGLAYLHGSGDYDLDGVTDLNELLADTIPTGSNSYFRITRIDGSNSASVVIACTNSRIYSLESMAQLLTGSWSFVAGQTNVPGEADGSMPLVDTNPVTFRLYRVRVTEP